MRAAIFGTGLTARLHIQALRELGHSAVWVSGTSPEKARSFAREWQIEGCGVDPGEALEADVQCVHICTPPVLHYEMAQAALLAGKHVLCEKPLCLNPQEARALMRLAQEKRLVNAVNFNVRFFDACRQAREVIAAPGFGEIHLIHGSYLQEFHALPDEYSWRYKPQLAGRMRAASEIGSHWIDLARYWSGLEVSEVSANFGSFTPQRHVLNNTMYAEAQKGSQAIRVDSEDAAAVSLRFSNGAMGNMLLSEVSHGRKNRLAIEVSGAQQSIWWHSEEPQYLCQGQKMQGVTTQINAFGGGFPGTFRGLFNAVYTDIASGRPSAQPTYPTFYDGYVNAAVCEAIWLSASHNAAWVKVNALTD